VESLPAVPLANRFSPQQRLLQQINFNFQRTFNSQFDISGFESHSTRCCNGWEDQGGKLML
ncbi:hypothetical protein RYX36_016019, partial [Vicia faba]